MKASCGRGSARTDRSPSCWKNRKTLFQIPHRWTSRNPWNPQTVNLRRQSEARFFARSPAFQNQAPSDFAVALARNKFSQALDAVRGKLGQTYPLVIGGDRVPLDRINGSQSTRLKPKQVIGYVTQGTTEDVARAVAAALQSHFHLEQSPCGVPKQVSGASGRQDASGTLRTCRLGGLRGG